MKTKQQAIQEAYGEHWENVSYYVDEFGWCKAFWSLFEKLDGITNPKSQGTLWRPKSLQGIENNNGWIRIESEDDLPKDFIKCHFIIKGHEDKHYIGHYYDDLFWNNCNDAYSWPAVSHYQPIEKPKTPIY